MNKWADEYRANATVRYGNADLEVDYEITKVNENVFEGKGVLKAEYQNGAICHYPVTVVIKAFTSGLYIKGLLPESVPSSIQGYCAGVHNIEVSHPKPYILVR